ncbi:hypothetical protein B0H16DRAFT_1761542, partial [Mycena metata]
MSRRLPKPRIGGPVIEMFTFTFNDHDVDDPCSSEDPNARLSVKTLQTLKEFYQNIDGAPATDDDLTFLFQYFKSSDIPGIFTPSSAKTLGYRHALVALQCFTEFLPHSDARVVERILQAWPEIEKWTYSTYTDWIVTGNIVGGVAENIIDAFNSIVPFFTVIAAIPALRNRVWKEESREMTMSLLLSCWEVETSKSFPVHHRSISAACPLTTFLSMDPKSTSGPLYLFRFLNAHRVELEALPLQYATSESYAAEIATNALTLLRNPHPRSLSHAHMKMLNLLSLGGPYSDALLAQQSIRDVTRLLSDLSSKPYDPENPSFEEECVLSCLQYLAKFIPTKDGFSNARMALQAGLLPAIVRCGGFTTQGSQAGAEIEKILHLISLYTVYPSVLYPFLASVRKIKELEPDIIDPNKPLQAAYLKLVHLVDDRVTAVRRECRAKIQLNAKCATCGREDKAGVFKACSGCFNLSYCSEKCQKQHWASHERECKAIQASRTAGKPLVMSSSDVGGIVQLAFSKVNLHRAEIVRVWKAEGPTRTPLVSFDFTENPAGVMTIGKACLDTPPGKTRETGVYHPEVETVVDGRAYFRIMWEDTTSRKAHDQDAIVGVFVAQGDTPKGRWSFFGIKRDLEEAEGTVFERLVRTVEDGVEFGLHRGPPVFFEEDKCKW